ncbi:hypothetical protein D5S17_23210 [Pseudonocardiaceae bacterium YIM PH 21723]|nr:hypothetical protein D5S17_23210 [Pseudonocardiaceae bacterium YIM PH 21723]
MTTDNLFRVPFSSAALRRLADGSKRATVLRLNQAARVRQGQQIIGVVNGSDARLALEVEQLHFVRKPQQLPSIAKSLGLHLSDFTQAPIWDQYLRDLQGPMVLAVLSPVGEITGTLPAGRVRKISTTSWHEVTDTFEIHPADQINDDDRAELRRRVRDRLGAAIRAEQPSPDLFRRLAGLTEAMLRSGRCGPAALGKAHRQRHIDAAERLFSWLAEHQVLTGTGDDRTWHRDLLTGLRINTSDRAAGTPGHAQQ